MSTKTPGKSSRRRRSADETRRLVLDAAVDWIEENGSASLKVVDIARASGVSEVLIYRYFDDRQGLLTAALVDLWERYMIEPLDAARQMIADLPTEAFTPEFLANIGVQPSTDAARKSRWARLQVLAASPENPELREMIKASQSRINDEHESLIELIRSRMPGRHLPSVRMMRMLNQNVIFGFVIEDLVDDSVSDEELRDFLTMFYRTMYEPEAD
ncbi:MAG: TetR/AcrR family transcriptional regulator [Actinomycetota bacterium]|jgi:AcrR family transcriptional regulator|nr:TetR/AcrR family transcriptional regulator [Actinomycetota bacterium]MDA3014255.1 TetR/AcrR family transcriptional regulator [Actinomycetota bacterium]MDA3027937.1 TetR/AcrR family transcriptional regulator [Actinomycetota bacterium]